MGTSLTGKQIKNTYKSLIKTSDSTEASATAKLLSDGNGNDFGVYIDTDGVFGIGSAPSYSLDVSSRTDGVALPVGTTANRPTPTNGLLRYNSTIGKIEFYDGGWKTVFTTSGGTIDGSLIVTGDLTIQGTTVTLNTETVQFEDNILLLNRADSDTQYDAVNAGIEIEKTSGTNPSFLYTYSTSTWGLTDSLTIEGNLTVDTNTLYVDSADNRVGIGTTNPTVPLEVEGELRVNSATARLVNSGGESKFIIDSATDSDAIIQFKESGGNRFTIGVDGSDGNKFKFGVESDLTTTTALTIDSSGRVLIGTQTEGHPNANDLTIAGTGADVGMTIRSDSDRGGKIFFSDATSGAGEYAGYIVYNHSDNSMLLGTNSFDRLKIDSSGRVGIGVTPSAWSSPNFTALQLGVGASIAGRGSAGTGDQIYISANTYYDGTTWKYIETNPASNYYQDNGEHVWRTATSGTAGNAITWNERMRIDSSGQVGIGETNPTRLLHLSQSGGNAIINLERTNAATSGTSFGAMQFLNSVGNSVASIYAISDTDNLGAAISFNTTNAASTENPYTGVTERVRITSSGVVQVRNTEPILQLYNTDASIVEDQVLGGLEFYGTDPSGAGLGVRSAIRSISKSSVGASYGLKFYTSSGTDNDLERMEILSGGDITFFDSSLNKAFYWDMSEASLGIGTTSPQSKFQISDSSAYSIITLNRTSGNTTGSYGALQWTASDNHSVAAIVGRADGDNEGAHLIFHTTSAASSNDPYSLDERMRITSGGNVGISSESPVSKLTLEGARNTNTITLRSTSNDSSWTVGDEFGAIEFYSNDASGGGAGVKSAISCFTTSSSGSTSVLSFSTSSTGTNNTEKMRLDTDGLKFNGDTAAANALDDYEEGTFTPYIEDASSNTASIDSATGIYTKIGRLVNISIVLSNINTTGLTSSDDLVIKGLPFSSNFASHGSVNFDNVTFSGNYVVAQVPSGANYIRLRNITSGSADNQLDIIAINSTSSDISLSVTYPV